MNGCDCLQCRLRRAREVTQAATGAAPRPNWVWGESRPRAPLGSHQTWLPLSSWSRPPELGRALDRVPDELADAVIAMAYVVCRIESAGPVDRLTFPDVDDRGRIAAVLEQAGLIETHQTPAGLTRWSRTYHAPDRRHRR